MERELDVESNQSASDRTQAFSADGILRDRRSGEHRVGHSVRYNDGRGDGDSGY